MDYQKVYNSFIDDRKEKEQKLFASGKYFEKHHIVPRSMGGSNNKQNIVALTPEDHFFAHLLLAKIYGGKMMRALFAMSNLKYGVNQRPDFSYRMKYGHIRRMVAREYSEKYSGENSPISDKKIYTLNNHDGRVASGTRIELSEKTGVSRRLISGLITGYKLNIKGWYNPKINKDGLSRKYLMRKNSKIISTKIYRLYHFDGRYWEGTRLSFKDNFGKNLRFQTKNGSCAGWYREKEQAENHFKNIKALKKSISDMRGDISGKNNPRFIEEKYCFVNFKTGEEIHCTRYDLSKMLNIKPSEVHCLFSRRQKTVRGWGLKDVFLIRDEIKTYRKDRHGNDKSRSGR